MDEQDVNDVIRAVGKIAARYRRKSAVILNLTSDHDESLEEAA